MSLSFKLQVVDSLAYCYPNQLSKSVTGQEPYVDVIFYESSEEIYESIKEGDRIRLTNLEPLMKNGERNKSKFEFATGCVEQYGYLRPILNLKATKFTNIRLVEDFIQNVSKRKEFKETGRMKVLPTFRTSISKISNDEILLEEFYTVEQGTVFADVDCVFHVAEFEYNSNNKSIELSGKDYLENEIILEVNFLNLLNF